MKFTTFEDGSGLMLEVGKRIVVHFYSEWKQIFQIGRCNWYTFTPVQMEVEYEKMSEYFEITCVLLGLGFILRYNYDFEHSRVQQLAEEAWREIEAEKNGHESQ